MAPGGTVCPVGSFAVDLAVGAPSATASVPHAPGSCSASPGRPPPAAAAPSDARPGHAGSRGGYFPWAAAACRGSPAPSPTAVIVDRDGDGIPDADDACPDQAGTAANHGCPRDSPARHRLGDVARDPRPVHFATGQSRIAQRSTRCSTRSPRCSRAIRIYCSSRSRAHRRSRQRYLQLLLSQARATAVLEYLAAKGVERDRLAAKGLVLPSIDSNGTSTGGQRTAGSLHGDQDAGARHRSRTPRRLLSAMGRFRSTAEHAKHAKAETESEWSLFGWVRATPPPGWLPTKNPKKL